MQAPIWYKDTEKWLLHYGKWAIVLGLVTIILDSVYFLVAVLFNGKYAIPAATWITYVFIP